MINFNNAYEIQIDGKQVEQIIINGVIVWDAAVWYNPIWMNKNLYVRSAHPQAQVGTNIDLGINTGGEKD